MSYTLNYRGAKIDELLGQVDEQFIAEYNVSLYADITAAIAAGKQVLLKKDNALYPYIGTDASSSYTFAMVDEDAILQLFTVSTASVWATVSKALQEELTFDAAPTDGSTNPVTSDGIYDAIEEAKSEIATSDQPGMTVGASENLISDTKIANSSPYLYRPVLSGVGNRAYSKLIGATIANNQLVAESMLGSTSAVDITFTKNDATITITGTATGSTQVAIVNNTAPSIPLGHKILVAGNKGGAQGITWRTGQAQTYYSTDFIAEVTDPATVARLAVRIYSGTTYNTEITPQIFDLTATFGSTIADYAYTLEQGQAGSGIAWLKSYGFFGKYAPYDAGSLISVKPTAKVVKNADETEEKTYDLGSDELRGLFKLDNGNIYADGDIKTPDGQITRKYGIVDLGTLTWVLSSYPGVFYAEIANIAIGAVGQMSNVLCSRYKAVITVANTSEMDSREDNSIAVRNATQHWIMVKDTAYSDTATFKTAMSGVYLVYELATPTTEQGTPFVDPSIVYPNGTEEYIDTRTVPVPVGNETEYSEDLKGGLETILDTPSANGTYVLKATVSGGVATLSWVSE